MVQDQDVPLKVRFVSRSLPLVETREGRYVVEPAIYGCDRGLRHCIVAHRERADPTGNFDVVELSPDFGSYPNLLHGFCYGFEVRPQKPSDRDRAVAILDRLIELRVAEVVN
jgi:hypothetical protein